MTRLGWAAIGVMVWLAAMGTAVAQDSPTDLKKTMDEITGRRKPTEEEAKEAVKEAEALRKFWAAVRREETIPGDLKGAAAAVPFGDKASGLKACLYVPTTYSPGRSWPLLVESSCRSAAAIQLKALQPMAEKHECLLLVVEYQFPQGRPVYQQKGWTREGTKDFTVVDRSLEDVLKDMAADEKNLLALLKQVSARYTVESKAVGATGFLWPGLMAYRLALTYPNVFSCCIVRTTTFDEQCLPKDVSRARTKPFYIVYGEREPLWAVEASQQAIDFFKRRQFSKVVVERIPNSGVDPRPEIAANYFRSAVEETLGPEQTAFYRAYSQAVRCVEGLPAAGDVAATEGLPSDKSASPGKTAPESKPAPPPEAPPTGDAPASDDNPAPADQPATETRPAPQVKPAPKPLPPPTAEVALASLKAFSEKYPKSAFKPGLDYITARLALEKLSDRKQADELLRPFLRSPLREEPVAVEALFYLAEKVIDRTTAAPDAAAVLGAILARRNTSPADIKRATELRKEILSGKASAK